MSEQMILEASVVVPRDVEALVIDSCFYGASESGRG